MSKVYIAGVWDTFHIGHLNILQRAKALGDFLVVGVLTDEATERYKPRTIIRQKDRLEIVKAIKYVDMAFFQKDTDPTKNGELQYFNPDILIHADDWDYVPGQDWMLEKQKTVMLLPYTPNISSTLIRERIIDCQPKEH